MKTQYTREQLLEVFNKVCNKTNWKEPIDSTCTPKDMNMVYEAVIFFAGCKPVFHPIHGTNLIRVTAPGYYKAVGA